MKATLRRILFYRVVRWRRSTTVLLFCVVNLLWSLVGNWRIGLGGIGYSYIDYGASSTLIMSADGWLMIAPRSSHFVSAGVWRDEYRDRKPLWSHFGWSYSMGLSVSRDAWQWRSAEVSDMLYDCISSGFRRLGIAFINEPESQGLYINQAFLIHWLWPAMIAAVVPAVRCVRYIANRYWNRQGLCAVCGYDLRATPTRCPECGTAIINPVYDGDRSQQAA